MDGSKCRMYKNGTEIQTRVGACWGASTGQTTAISGTYNLTADITLYPVWIPDTYTVTYEESGGATTRAGDAPLSSTRWMTSVSGSNSG